MNEEARPFQPPRDFRRGRKGLDVRRPRRFAALRKREERVSVALRRGSLTERAGQIELF
jgi:hypothetical protein